MQDAPSTEPLPGIVSAAQAIQKSSRRDVREIVCVPFECAVANFLWRDTLATNVLSYLVRQADFEPEGAEYIIRLRELSDLLATMINTLQCRPHACA